MDTIPHLQRTIGNQAVQRLLKASLGDVKGNSSSTRIARFGPDFSQIAHHSYTTAGVLPKLMVDPTGCRNDPVARDPVRIEDYKKGLAQPTRVIQRPPISAVGAAVIQRTASFVPGAVHATNNLAYQLAETDEIGITLETLNGIDLTTKAPGTAIARPTVDGRCLVTGGIECRVAAVPNNVGSFDETVLSSGPWDTVTAKANIRKKFGLSACSGAGNTRLTAHGKPSDAAVATANRTHEDRHAADHAAAFARTIGKWDGLLTIAKNSNTAFHGADTPACEAALFAAMGGTPDNVATNYRDACEAAGLAFHATPAGDNLRYRNESADGTCSTCSVDVIIKP